MLVSSEGFQGRRHTWGDEVDTCMASFRGCCSLHPREHSTARFSLRSSSPVLSSPPSALVPAVSLPYKQSKSYQTVSESQCTSSYYTIRQPSVVNLAREIVVPPSHHRSTLSWRTSKQRLCIYSSFVADVILLHMRFLLCMNDFCQSELLILVEMIALRSLGCLFRLWIESLFCCQ